MLQQAAASTLLQLHDTDLPNAACGDNENLTNDTPHFGTRRLNAVNTNRPYISGSWDNMAYGSRNVAQPPESMNMTQNAFMYSQVNMQKTIAGLTSAMGNIQEEHLNMHTRQENITGTLTQVLSVLKELKDGNYTSAPNQRSASSLQNEDSTLHPWSSSIDRHTRSGSDETLSYSVSLSRDVPLNV